MRTLPFEYALIVGDQIARKFNVSRQKILRFACKRRHCWKLSATLFKLGFIDAKSENGGESFCRGRIIRAGFVTPTLQKEIENPLFALHRHSSPTLQSTRIIRPDYVWTINHPKKSSSTTRTRQFQHIAAELDGKGKYFDRSVLASSHTDTAAVIMREKDRETALSLKNFKLVRFQFSEAYELQGDALIEKLRLAGVPIVNRWEARRRERLLARYTGHKTLLRLD
ncbi:hypothetical protein [Alloscardovia theropitheci]|nr:hypothetical protein [Alloscardovia theropitheci]